MQTEMIRRSVALKNLWEQRDATRWASLLAMMAALCLPLEEYYVQGTHTNMNFVLMFLVLILAPKKPHRKLGLRKMLVPMASVYIVLSFIVMLIDGNQPWYSMSSLNNIFYTIPIMFILLYFYTDTFSVRGFLKWTTMIAVITSVVIILQRLVFLLTGSTYLIPTLDFVPGFEFGRELSLEDMVRPCAIFSEPAHYAEYCLPVAAYHLLKRHLWTSILICFGIIVSGSTNGLVGLAVVVVSVFFMEHNREGKDKHYFLLIGALLVLVGVIYSVMDYYFPEIMASQFSKAENTSVGESARLLGPLPILLNFDILDWLFGIGIGNKDGYILYYHLPVAGGTNDKMTNTFFSLLVFFGIIGFVVFFIFMLHMYIKCCRGAYITFILLMVALFFSTNFIFAGNLLHYTFFAANSKYIKEIS